MKDQITHLVFSGNALRSICLCGVLRYLYCYNLHSHIRDVAGTSMGAFFGFAFALKIPIEELEEIIYKLSKNPKFSKFDSSSFLNIIDSYGLSSSLDYFESIREYLNKHYNQNDITFLELSKKTGINLYVSTTCLTTGKNEIFNVNDTPNISVIDAIAASMCIPILSKPIKIGKRYYIDGCLSNNFPIECFVNKNSNINKNNILGVGVLDFNNNGQNSSNDNQEEEDDNLSLIKYMANLSYLMHINTYKYCFSEKISNHPNVLIIKNSPIRSILKPKIEDNYIDIGLTDDEINNLILQGFKEMNDYYNNNDI